MNINRGIFKSFDFIDTNKGRFQHQKSKNMYSKKKATKTKNRNYKKSFWIYDNNIIQISIKISKLILIIAFFLELRILLKSKFLK